MEPAAVSIFKMKKDQSGLKQHSASKCVMQDTKKKKPLAFVVSCTVLRLSRNSSSAVSFSAEYMIKNKLQNHFHLFVCLWVKF